MSELKYLGNNPEQGYVSTSDAARLASCTQTHIGRICRNGEVECIRVGREWFIAKDSLEKYLSTLALRKEARAEELRQMRQREYQEALSQKASSVSEVKGVERQQKPFHLPVLVKSLAAAFIFFCVVGVSALALESVSEKTGFSMGENS